MCINCEAWNLFLVQVCLGLSQQKYKNKLKRPIWCSTHNYIIVPIHSIWPKDNDTGKSFKIEAGLLNKLKIATFPLIIWFSNQFITAWCLFFYIHWEIGARIRYIYSAYESSSYNGAHLLATPPGASCKKNPIHLEHRLLGRKIHREVYRSLAAN